MFKRILVPLDGTPQSNAALRLARTMARTTGAAITLLRVLPESLLQADGTANAAVNHTLERVASELAENGVQVNSVVRVGHVVQQILDQSRAQAADLIVMRTHGRVGLERAVLGSVTQGVLAASQVPVLLMRPGGHHISHIKTLLVPIDGSPGGAVALGIAVGLARATAASLELLDVAVPIPLYVYAGYEYGGITAIDPAWDEEALASARTYVDSIVARLRAVGITVNGNARMEPDVSGTIVARAEETNADLIVMSTQALSGVARALLGSVADAVVRSSHCPVLLLHRAETERQTQSTPRPHEFAAQQS
jgi:nucleotide-binding universal stress UspA family protein